TLPSSSRTAWPSRTFSPSNTRPPTYNVAIAQNSFRKVDSVLSARGALAATQRVFAGRAALCFEPLDLGVDSHDVRIVLLGQFERRHGTAGLAHFGADHAEARIGAKVARLALDGLADVGQRGWKVAEQPLHRSALVPGFRKIRRQLDQLGEGRDRRLQLLLH